MFVASLLPTKVEREVELDRSDGCVEERRVETVVGIGTSEKGRLRLFGRVECYDDADCVTVGSGQEPVLEEDSVKEVYEKL